MGSMRMNKIWILSGLVLLITISCSQYKTLTIENKKPPKVAVPEDIQSLTLMNRSLSSEFSNFNEDSLQRYFYNNSFNLNKFVLDSTSADTCLKALGEVLFESGRFDIVIPQERNIYKGSKYYMASSPLEWNYVSNLCELYNTDALLVLERFTTQVNTDFNAEMYMEGNYYYATIDIGYNAFFRIYDPAQEKIASEFVINDTIYWEYGDNSQRKLFNTLPSIKQALINTGIRVALDVDEELSPEWVPENRGYFVIQAKNEQEKQMIANLEWDKLKDYWSSFTVSSSKRIKSMAEYNMALTSELDGDIEEALNWAIKSYKTSYRIQTEEYINKLMQRKKALDKLHNNINP